MPIDATDSGSHANAESGIWFLQVDERQIRGPVSLASLRQWAEAGTLAADDQISPDAQTWRAAASLPALEMDWLTDLESGATYGPFNIKAVRPLVERGILKNDSVLRRRTVPRAPTSPPSRPAPHPTSPGHVHTTRAADERVYKLERELHALRDQMAAFRKPPPAATGHRALTDTTSTTPGPADRPLERTPGTEDVLEGLNRDYVGTPAHLPAPASEASINRAARSRLPLPPQPHVLSTHHDDDPDWEHPADLRELARTRRYRVQTVRWNMINSSLVIGAGVTVGAIGVILDVEPVQYTGVVLSFLGVAYFGIAMLLLLSRKLANWANLSVVSQSAPADDGHPLRGVMNITIYWFNRKFRTPARR